MTDKMYCKTCECEIKVRPNARYCEEHRIEAKAARKKEEIARSTAARKLLKEGARAAIIPHVKGKPQTKVTDAMQMKINKACDKGYNFPMLEKVYQPGSKEFKQAAKDIIERRGLSGSIPAQFKYAPYLSAQIRQYVAG